MFKTATNCLNYFKRIKISKSIYELFFSKFYNHCFNYWFYL